MTILYGSQEVTGDMLAFDAISRETARWYDFSYSSRVRCIQRVWFEVSVRGKQRGFMRMVTQNTGSDVNKAYGVRLARGDDVLEVIQFFKGRDNLMMWGDPIRTGYSAMMIPFFDGKSVHHIPIGLYEKSETLLLIRRDLYEHFPSWAKVRFDELIESSRSGFSSSWKTGE